MLEGDCFELLAALEPASADAIISDPPYGTTSLEWDGPVDWERWWPLVDRASKPEAPVVLFSALPAACALIASNARNYRYDLIWEKSNPTGFLDAGRRPLRAHEQILVFCRKPRAAIYNPRRSSTACVGTAAAAAKRATTAGTAPWAAPMTACATPARCCTFLASARIWWFTPARSRWHCWSGWCALIANRADW